MKSRRPDYKYKICPIEYTTKLSATEEIIKSNGHELNAAMDRRFKEISTRYKYTSNFVHKIPGLTERLFNMKIFYGINSYWVSF